MRTDLEQRLRRGLHEYADAIPVVAPNSMPLSTGPLSTGPVSTGPVSTGPVSTGPLSTAAGSAPVPQVRTNGHLPRKRSRWLGPALAGTAVAGIVALLTPATSGLLAGAAGGRLGTAVPPILPEVFPPHSTETASLSAAPVQRVIATYQFSSMDTTRDGQDTMALAGDHDAARVVDVARVRGRDGVPAPTLLAGDGSKIAVRDLRGPERDIAIVNVATGVTRPLPLGFEATVNLLAWSPDARFLAYAARDYEVPVAAPQPTGVPRGGRLAMLDTATGERRSLSADGIPEDVAGAAFSADGTQLAVQGSDTTSDVVIMDPVSDVVVHRISVPESYRIAGQQAWSPDGGLLAMEKQQQVVSLSVRSWTGPVISVSFLRTTSTSGPLLQGLGGSERVLWFLGWRSTERVVVFDLLRSFSIVESNLAGGMRRVLAQVDADPDDDQYIWSLQVAWALLPALQSRSVGAAHRAVPRWVRWSIPAPVLLLVTGTLYVLLRRQRRKPRVPPAVPLRSG
jgi:hypothetical protein